MKTEDGISPLIGTILLVVITVILIAIISAIVMGITAPSSNKNVLQGEQYITVYQLNNDDLVYMLTQENYCNIIHVYVDGKVYDVNLNALENEYHGEYKPYTVSNISNGSHNIRIVGIYRNCDTNCEIEMYNKTLIF